jgi:hypothetical protein
VSSHDVTVAVYGVFALAGLGLQARSASPRSRIPSFGAVCSRVMRTRSGRVGVIAGWAWLGLHFFAR